MALFQLNWLLLSINCAFSIYGASSLNHARLRIHPRALFSSDNSALLFLSLLIQASPTVLLLSFNSSSRLLVLEGSLKLEFLSFLQKFLP